MTRTRALVRLMLMRQRRDAASGLNTLSFGSGYRGTRHVESDRLLGFITKRRSPFGRNRTFFFTHNCSPTMHEAGDSL